MLQLSIFYYQILKYVTCWWRWPWHILYRHNKWQTIISDRPTEQPTNQPGNSRYSITITVTITAHSLYVITRYIQYWQLTAYCNGISINIVIDITSSSSNNIVGGEQQQYRILVLLPLPHRQWCDVMVPTNNIIVRFDDGSCMILPHVTLTTIITPVNTTIRTSCTVVIIVVVEQNQQKNTIEYNDTDTNTNMDMDIYIWIWIWIWIYIYGYVYMDHNNQSNNNYNNNKDNNNKDKQQTTVLLLLLYYYQSSVHGSTMLSIWVYVVEWTNQIIFKVIVVINSKLPRTLNWDQHLSFNTWEQAIVLPWMNLITHTRSIQY